MRTSTCQALLTLAGCGFAAGAFGEVLLADPSLIQNEGRYYLVGTENGIGATPETKLSGKGVFPLYVSDDLYTWRLAETPLGEGRLMEKASAGKWGHWAPQLFKRGARWYFAYTSDYRWSIAAGERPEGPFKPLMTYPVKAFAIDPAILFDDDGRAYCYFAGGDCIRAIEMKADLTSCIGTNAILCVVNDQPWEHKPLAKHYEELNAKHGYTGWNAFQATAGVIEGPSVVKRRGKYVLFYSANNFRSPDYCVGVAVADRPLGPWKKLQDAAVISNEQTGLNGTGHGDVFTAADGSLWYVFHAHNSSIRISPRRTGAIRLKETPGADGYPRYASEPATMRLF